MLDLDLHPNNRKLRQFGVAATLFFSAVAYLLWRSDDAAAKTFFGGAATFLAVASLLFALAWPRGNRPLYITLTVVTFPIGFFLSYVLFAAVFYGLVTPIGLALRIARARPAIDRRFRPPLDSHWKPATVDDDPESYFRQF